MSNKAKLILSNGDVFTGSYIGFNKSVSGQLVFTTSMVGYTETLTDPSYHGQIVVFSYPLIGNYGVPKLNIFLDSNFESEKIHAHGVVISQEALMGSHFEKVQEFSQWLASQNIPCIVGPDTRELVKIIRNNNSILAKIQINEVDCEFYDPNCYSVIKNVSCKEVKYIGNEFITIGVIDCGVKWNILRSVLNLHCNLIILPWDTNFSLFENKVDGWLISNGPGDPTKTENLPTRIKELLTKNKPVLGICLGFQLISLAIGAQTRKLTFGHRSLNQPVIIPNTFKGFLTSQNHGFEVIKETLPSDWDIWFLNGNDDTLEGIKHHFKPFYAVQFHPEAAAGPHDTYWIFEDFINQVKMSKSNANH